MKQPLVRQSLVVQGEVARLLLQKLLGPEWEDTVEIVDGGICRTDAPAKARRDLMDGFVVALVVDANSCDPLEIRQVRHTSERHLVERAPSDQSRLFLVVPQLELLLFQQEGLVRRLVGRAPTPEELERARSEPRLVLQEMLGQGNRYAYMEEMARRLQEVDVSPLRATPLCEEIVAFFRDIPDYLRRHLRLPPYDKEAPWEPPPGPGVEAAHAAPPP